MCKGIPPLCQAWPDCRPLRRDLYCRSAVGTAARGGQLGNRYRPLARDDPRGDGRRYSTTVTWWCLAPTPSRKHGEVKAARSHLILVRSSPPQMPSEQPSILMLDGPCSIKLPE